jgi:hypothetical protein
VLAIGGLLMTRSIWTLVVLWLALTVAPAAAERNPRDRHLRSTDPELVDLIADGVGASPTLQRLVERVEASDVIVYLMFDRSPSPSAAAHISLLTAVPGRRYLRISFDRRYAGAQRLALLGHELQHAVEIADAPSVADDEGVAALYKSIGFRSDRRRECYDSRLAIETGRQVQREILAAANSAGSR